MNTYLYVFDTLADWEIGYLTAELNSGRFFKNKGTTMPVIPVATEMKPIKTMGGLEINPQMRIADAVLAKGDLLILPGGDSWLEPGHEQILDKAAMCVEQEVWVAAICGATLALADKGLLDNRKHTSNDLEFLKTICPRYAGSELYQPEPAVADQYLITASGIAPLEFAYLILKTTDVFKPETLEAWYHLYKQQEARYFYQLMASMAG